MIYSRKCTKCAYEFDVVRGFKDMEMPDPCTKCGGEALYQFAPTRILFSGAAVVNAEYNPGLGCIVNNSNHRKELIKQKGLIEIGNENPEATHKYYEKTREDRREAAWAEASKGWVGAE